MDKRVIIPKYLQEGIKPLKNSYPKNINLIVFDVETENGIPYLLTFYDGKKITYFKVNADSVLVNFLQYLNEHYSKHRCNVLFAHNLQFDLFAVLCKKEREIARFRSPPPIIHELGIFKKVVYQKTQFAQLKLKKNANVKIIDSTNFIKGSLKGISVKLGFKNKKRNRPDFVEEGRAPRTRKEWQKLYRYCNSEIKATYELAENILEMHKRYDCGICVSASQLSSKVFRKHFLKMMIPQIPSYIHKLVIETIHGGRADVFVDSPITIPNVKMYDYNSFYPWAMANLPPLTSGRWKHVDRFVNDYEGFYRITGYVHKCKYPVVLKNGYNFEYASGERVFNSPIVSYELREALRSGELDLEKAEGWILIPDEKAENPFKAFVGTFYKLKSSTPKEDPLYMTYKLLLNCLYGKTYQTVRLTDYEEEPQLTWSERSGKVVKNEILYHAGGLYLPHVGSWITSMCRAKLHEDLHRYQAIDCATDSFKTLQKIPQSDKLGGLKLEAEGLLLLIKPKLYVIFSNRIQKEVEKEGDLRTCLKKNLNSLEIREDKDIVKYASHGFWGDVKQLLELYVEKGNEYIVKHMVKVREAIRQKKQPRVMETQKRHINVDWNREIRPCGVPLEKAVKTMELCCGNCFQCAYLNEY